MSGIAGIFNRDGRPVDLEVLGRMTDAAAHRGMDGAGYWSNGVVGLGHRMFHTTPESLTEKQPFTNESGSFCLTFDGRVDNREELLTELSAAGYRLQTNTDAEIVLRAYECWGENSPRKIVGDFAYAIWDERQSQLFCVRDCLYMRPFYYYINSNVFLFASELHQLFESPDVPQRPNEGMVGEFLTGSLSSREETLWRDISRLPSAHYLLVNKDHVRKVKYWDIDPQNKIRYRRDEEYAEHFREVFREAVRCRTRSLGPIAADLSGGLDSSSVVCMVQELAKQNVVDAAGFKTFSWVFPDLDCDESNYINDVVKRWSLNSDTWTPKITDASFFRDRASRYRDFPGYPNGSMVHAYHAVAREQGYRVILTGEGGDEWLNGGLDYFVEILLHSGPTAAMREAFREGGMTATKNLLSSTARLYLRPFVPGSVLRSIRTRRVPSVPTWIDSEFAKRIELNDRLRGEDFESPFVDRRVSNAGTACVYGMVNAVWSPHSFEISDREDMRVGIEARNPLMDRRIAELALALPHEQRQRGKRGKYVMREAMRDALPESVRNRTDKTDFMHFFAQALSAVGDEFCSNSAPVRFGWVKKGEMSKMYRDVLASYEPGGLRKPVGAWPLWMTYGIGIWWDQAVERTRERRPTGSWLDPGRVEVSSQGQSHVYYADGV